MAKVSDYAAVGTIKSIDQDGLIFCPLNTSYELRLLISGKCEGPIGARVEGFIRVSARKIYTVPSGGNFISPIFGPPRIIQGRVRYLDDIEMIVQAGTPVIVELPKGESAFDLASGDLTLASLVNVVALPGARFELATLAAAK